MYPKNVSYCIILYGLKVGVDTEFKAGNGCECKVWKKKKFLIDFLNIIARSAAAEMTCDATQKDSSDSIKKACNICGKILASMRNLDNHVKKVHGKVIILSFKFNYDI